MEVKHNFQVTLTMDASADMLAGMSATVQLPLESKTAEMVIPLAALREDGVKTIVYTALDEKTGLPAMPVPVETGISDAACVQILSGLKPGTTVYYSYYDPLELDTSAEASRFAFG